MPNQQELLQFIKEIYSDIDGYNIAREAAESFSLRPNDHLLYGETTVDTAKSIFDSCNIGPEETLVEIGSGTSTISIVGHLLFSFKQVYGVELLEGLYNKSQEIKNIIQKQVWYNKIDKNIDFINSDFFDFDLRVANTIYMNHFFKDPEMRKK